MTNALVTRKWQMCLSHGGLILRALGYLSLGKAVWGSTILIQMLGLSDGPGHVQTVATQGQASLPGQLVIVTDKGKTSKEQGNLVVKEAMCAMLQAWDAPFRSAPCLAVQKLRDVPPLDLLLCTLHFAAMR